MRRRPTPALLAVATACLLLSCAPQEGGDGAALEALHLRVADRVRSGFPPDPHVFHVTLEALEKGTSPIVALREFVAGQRGRRVVLEIGGTWCPPCLQAYRNLPALAREYPDTVIGLLAVEKDLDFGSTMAALDLAYDLTGNPSFPAYVVLDASGRPVRRRMLQTLDAVRRELDGPAAAGDAGPGRSVEEVLGALGGKRIFLNSSEAPAANRGLKVFRQYAAALERDAGVRTCYPASLGERGLLMSVESSLSATLPLMCDIVGCTVHAFPGATGERPLLVFAPVEEAGAAAPQPAAGGS